MKSLKCVLAIVAVVMVLFVVPQTFAQDSGAGNEAVARAANWGTFFGKGMGIGLTILGGGYAIALIASRAVESMARQPEVAGNIQGAMVIAAAMVEGAVFFALLICWFGMN